MEPLIQIKVRFLVLLFPIKFRFFFKIHPLTWNTLKENPFIYCIVRINSYLVYPQKSPVSLCC